MSDDNAIETCLEALAVASAAIMEDAHELAATNLPGDPDVRSSRLADLRSAGDDLVQLAQAMMVLDRRHRSKTGCIHR